MLGSGAGRSRLLEINGLPDHPPAGGSFHTVTFGNENKSAPCWCPMALHGGFYLKAVFL
jgi:hypothetical protein